MRGPILLVLATIVSSVPAMAEDGDCSGFKWPVAREMAAFKTASLPTVASGASLPGLSQAATLNLVPQDQATYEVLPGRKPKHSPAYGGTFMLPSVAAADTYQVTISADAWIDVVQDGKVLKQVGFTGAHGCETVHKSVRFSLAGGPATVQISDAARDTLRIEVLPKEK